MTYISCSVPERFVNPLFEVFDGGDFILSSYRDIEEDFTRMRIYLEDAARVAEARSRLEAAMAIVGVKGEIETAEIPDEDWKFSYRRHFQIEAVGRRLLVVPTWELDSPAAKALAADRLIVTLDPRMALGTGKNVTTRACLEYVEELAAGSPRSFLDMGSGSGILSITAARLGYAPVAGFDVDPEAVKASTENAALNGVAVEYRHAALGRHLEVAPLPRYDVVVANILAPLLIRFADEIAPRVGRYLVVSGILNGLYPEVLSAYAARGFAEVSKKTLGEWTTGLLTLKEVAPA